MDHLAVLGIFGSSTARSGGWLRILTLMGASGREEAYRLNMLLLVDRVHRALMTGSESHFTSIIGLVEVDFFNWTRRHLIRCYIGT